MSSYIHDIHLWVKLVPNSTAEMKSFMKTAKFLDDF